MHERYSKNAGIKRIWSTENKLGLWQKTELAVIDARAGHGEIPKEDAAEIRRTLEATPIDIAWWKAKDAEINHDLIAFVEERRRHLPERLQHLFHERLTSYDTEEGPFATMLHESVAEVDRLLVEFAEVLIAQTKRYRFTVMLGETHGQWAELQTFGKRIATWLKAVVIDTEQLRITELNLEQSKLSGAIGNSPDLSPEIQRTALKNLGFVPFLGATQIIPRELYAPIASALGVIVATLAKMAMDLRLNARSGRPLVREPFKKTQKGSSRMPQKRNPITWEQMKGMLSMSEGYVLMIQQNIQTWNERDIGQSCVERVAWPDLFYVVTHCLGRMTGTLEGLQVYQDEMLREINDCRGIYAASKAADFLSEHGLQFGLTPKDAYRIVQLAAFNVFEPDSYLLEVRTAGFASYDEAQEVCVNTRKHDEHESALSKTSLRTFITLASLRMSPDLEAAEEKVQEWNDVLKKIFAEHDAVEKWHGIFSFEYNLSGEALQIDGVLAEAETMFGTVGQEPRPQP